MSSGFRGITGPRPHYSTIRLTTGPLRSGNIVVLQVEDGFLTKIDEDLPFTRHVVSAVEKIDLVEDFKGTVPVRTEEVVVGDPESQVIVGAIKIVETVSM